MGVVSETTFGARDLSEAVALERMEGGMVKQIRLQVEQSLGYLAEGRVGKAMGILRACLVGLDQIEMLDQAEAELLTEDTSAHLRGARDEGREIISLTQPMHVVA
jgi:hypothetical protein